ncbi:hypothetical protein LF1_34770 [Rubripirellula obstinata]|uniref:Uncharacterized protein n=1 Tax=Rubripirellula obstinata TaxID=406547 RepID=A0A5B1CM10_9BACT|nr:hypothetical protein LF1_34770 [Rubripirellula obstinata]
MATLDSTALHEFLIQFTDGFSPEWTERGQGTTKVLHWNDSKRDGALSPFGSLTPLPRS